ncbi:MAG: DUF934 domain-containing protein [Alphaproteobacteria bacterium]|nr:DUF934 domain-containing protein [Alphaproteobacteria bacterium]
MPTKHLIIDGATASDQWQTIADDISFDGTLDEATLDGKGAIISLARLEAEADTLRQRNTPIGVILRAGEKVGEDPHRLAPFLDMLSLVAIEFPVYRNGRGFSAARILREQYNYKGELRATGDVLYDQWQFMHRCGINAYEIDGDIPLATFTKAMDSLPDAYQPAGDDKRGILWRRS